MFKLIIKGQPVKIVENRWMGGSVRICDEGKVK